MDSVSTEPVFRADSNNLSAASWFLCSPRDYRAVVLGGKDGRGTSYYLMLPLEFRLGFKDHILDLTGKWEWKELPPVFLLLRPQCLWSLPWTQVARAAGCSPFFMTEDWDLIDSGKDMKSQEDSVVNTYYLSSLVYTYFPMLPTAM